MCPFDLYTLPWLSHLTSNNTSCKKFIKIFGNVWSKCAASVLRRLWLHINLSTGVFFLHYKVSSPFFILLIIILCIKSLASCTTRNKNNVFIINQQHNHPKSVQEAQKKTRVVRQVGREENEY